MQVSGAGDYRSNSAIEDSSAMTIEFLRARLSSERSVSKTARQRADQLAKKVMELEEELKIVSIQRKKAEKAAAEVLAILENYGITEFSETLDSSSDPDEVVHESKESTDSVKEGDQSLTSKSGNKGQDGSSASETEASPSIGKSLSWKSANNRPNTSVSKYYAQARRRYSSSLAASGSSKNRLGKSCRQIKRKDVRAVAEDAQENGAATGQLNTSNPSDHGSEMLNRCSNNKEKTVPSESQRIQHGAGLHYYASDKDGEMERALEQQALLIGRFEAEENAQKEWEDKYRENNSNLDSCEPGNQSDITEEKNEPHANEETDPVDTVPAYDNGHTPDMDKVHRTKDSSFIHHIPPGRAGHDQNNPNVSMEFSGQQSNKMSVSDRGIGSKTKVAAQEYPVAKTEGKQSVSGSFVDLKFQHVQHESQIGLVTNYPCWSDVNVPKGERSGRQNEPHDLSCRKANSLGGVLDALQRAKLSIQQELKFPSASQGTLLALPDTRSQSMKVSDAMDIPLGSSGLFKVPTEFKNRTFYSNSTPYYDYGSARHHSDISFGTVSSYLEPGSRISTPYVDPYLNWEMEMPTMSIIPSNDRHLVPYPDRRIGMTPGDQYALYEDHFRSSPSR